MLFRLTGLCIRAVREGAAGPGVEVQSHLFASADHGAAECEFPPGRSIPLVFHDMLRWHLPCCGQRVPRCQVGWVTLPFALIPAWPYRRVHPNPALPGGLRAHPHHAGHQQEVLCALLPQPGADRRGGTALLQTAGEARAPPQDPWWPSSRQMKQNGTGERVYERLCHLLVRQEGVPQQE